MQENLNGDINPQISGKDNQDEESIRPDENINKNPNKMRGQKNKNFKAGKKFL